MKLAEDSSTKDQDLIALKDWLKKQPHLPDEWDEVFLMTFLKNCKFSLEQTKRKLDFYFTMKAACPEFFANRDITRPELMFLMEKAQNVVLPGLTPEGRQITVSRALDKKLETHLLKDAFKIVFMITDIKLREQPPEVTGDVYIVDASVVEARHLGTLSPSVLKKFFICAQEAYPVKIKEVHVVNVTPLIDALYAIIKPFLKEKIKRRVFFHKECSTLQTYFPKDILPIEYGGTGISLVEVNKQWLEILKENRSWFKEQESLKANEALRPGNPRNYDELFGMDGSFRQLSID